MTILARAPFTAELATVLATATEKDVGVGHAPTGADAKAGYLLLYPIDGGGYSGPVWAAPDADAEWVYQVTVVGGREDQVERIADVVRTTFLDRGAGGAFTTAIDVDGMAVIDRNPAGGGGFDPESAADITVVSWPERFSFTVTPA